MDPAVRYDLREGEWRPDPPHVSYGADRSGLAALLKDEQNAMPWTTGESETGPVVEVRGRTIGCPPGADDLEWLQEIASPAPYGRGEETLLDLAVRDALQIRADDITLEGPAWDRLRTEMLERVSADMGLGDAELRLELLKLLVYPPGGHFSEHADTEKTPGMVASLSLIAPGAYDGGALTIEHRGQKLAAGAGGADRWRWAAWYADCRHRLDAVEDGVRVALTFAIALDPEKPLAPRTASSARLGWTLWERSYAEWHTEWAARENRRRAGNEQYGHKTVWVLSHRYTGPGLRAGLLKGRDRELARLFLDEPHGEAAYLAWLQIREVGSACTAQGWGWGDDKLIDLSLERDHEDDPPPASMREGWHYWGESDPAPLRITHRETPELHLKHVARQNVWVEGLRSLGGEEVDHGPIEVLDGEIVPPGALARAAPTGARVYEATGNKGASLELQYRHAVLVLWRRNEATLRMLARCGGRLALAVELAHRREIAKSGHKPRGGAEEVMELWSEASTTDGGGPQPRAHRLVLEALEHAPHPDERRRLRELYVERVAPVDLDAEVVPTLVDWISERQQAGTPLEPWVHALRPACSRRRVLDRRGMNGAPALLRALLEREGTRGIACELAAERDAEAVTPESVLRHAKALEVKLAEDAWWRRRTARMTMDHPEPAEEPKPE